MLNVEKDNKRDAIKNILINIGIMLILIGATAVKGDNLTFFFMGLILLVLQTFTIKEVEPGKLVMAEIMLSATLSIGAVSQLVMAKSFGAPQGFMVILLLGGLLIVVEAVRKYADL